MIALAIAGTGLATAMAAAEIGKTPGLSPETTLSRTIARQRVAAAQPATLPAPATATPPSAPTPPSEAETRQAILAEVDRAEAELGRTVSRLEGLKKTAYQAKDLIRVGFVASKLDEVKLLASMIQPVIDSIRQPGLDLFVMRSKLTTIRQGMEQARKAAAEAEAAQGDSYDTFGAALDSSGSGRNDDTGVTDPQGPPDPTADRPAQASPYR